MSFQGSTPSSNTGPTSAYEGYTYSYIEASSPRTILDEAILQSPSITTSRTLLIFINRINSDIYDDKQL